MTIKITKLIITKVNKEKTQDIFLLLMTVNKECNEL